MRSPYKCVREERLHDNVIKWKHFPRYWPFVRGIHRSPINSPHKGQICGALMFSLICAWIHGSVNNRQAGDLRRHRAHYDVTVMESLVTYRRFSVNTACIPTCVAEIGRADFTHIFIWFYFMNMNLS